MVVVSLFCVWGLFFFIEENKKKGKNSSFLPHKYIQQKKEKQRGGGGDLSFCCSLSLSALQKRWTTDEVRRL